MKALLKVFKDLFSWQCIDMPYITTDIIFYEKKMDLTIKPID